MSDDPCTLGKVLVSLGYCCPTEVTAALKQVNGTTLGETLVGMGVITRPQLAWALTYQKMDRGEITPKQALQSQHQALREDLGDFNRSTHAVAARMHKLG